ncbi:serine/threonine-protein kinase [Streptomyces sp. Tu 3180]|uniref:serine/threonine-protein kinase n=1 Tax=Streptomyces sp. Tu 3180 TaxID=2682611 RepID=UPI00135840A0|nr:serine/threonine-protein kinase [Streptomyces sp. Tu 3180]KAF3468534.1 serine/threonine protein kinase [Streptomyces sp. Tu 3180]
MQITPLNPEDPPSMGDFELLGRIGQGGMGQVYLGESPGGEPAAVKVIKPSVVDSESRRRFAQEIEVLKTIWGPRLAAFLGADAEAEQPWLATEYVDGPDLARHVETHGPLPSVLVAALGAVLAEALSAVHTQGLLHRDLKPANVLLGPNGPKIIDFGLAAFTEASVSLTAPHQVVGTPVCMAPEQAAGVRPLTAAVDVYALGALLLFAATGHYPHEAATPYMVFHLVTSSDTAPDLSGAPGELVPLLTAMLAHDAGDRPPLTDVVRRCRSVIEAQGMRIAQARRRLTAHTAGQRNGAASAVAPPTLPWPAPVSDTPGTEITPADLDAPAPSDPPAPAPTVAETVPGPADPAVRDSPAPAPPARPDPAEPSDAARREQPGPGRPPTASRRPGEGTRTPRHSVQARRTAERLRAAYAAKAPF